MHKAIVINGSPRMAKGNTAMVLTPFVEGMTGAGATVELVYASRLKVRPCACGRMHCWYREPGECAIKDDMQALYPRLREAETLILATPVYIPLPGDMQNVVNRLCPLVEPLLETREGRTRARFRDGVSIRRIALVCTSGWWERANCDIVVHIGQELAQNAGVAFAGAALRPHAFMMREGGRLSEEGEAVADALRQAGRELVQQGVMSEETLAAVSRPLISQEQLRREYNESLA